MKANELLQALQHMIERHDAGDFDVVFPDAEGHLTIAEIGVSVAEPDEKLLAVGCPGFVLRKDLESA